MKKYIFIFILLTFTFFIHAEESVRYLFINSYPIRAKIMIEGKDSVFLTPCILRDISLKSKITIKKEGFISYVLTEADIASKKVTRDLTPSSFSLFFPERTNYQIEGTEVKGPVFVSKLKTGKYDVGVNKNKISFSNSTNLLPFETAFGATFTCSLGVMIGSIVMSEYFSSAAKEANSKGLTYDYEYNIRSSKNADIAKYVSIGTTSLLGLILIGFINADIVYKFKQKTEKLQISYKIPVAQDESFYDSAVQLLGSGDIDKSTQILKSIISVYPDSDLLPKIYYQLGQNYFIQNDYENALIYWDSFIRDYPTADYFDYVIKNQSDIYYAKKDLKNARTNLDKIVFTENIINRELIYSFRAKLDLELYSTEKKEEYYQSSENEYLTLINDFPSSEMTDMYFSQLIKLYNFTSNADKIQELKVKAENLNGTNVNIKQKILSYFSK
jgi:outer membrane protein assembly factor BamD (BamD/ComL family)